MNMSFNPQPKCGFFAAPYEIRRAIYAHIIPDRIHLSLREKGIRLSACVRRDKDGDPNCFDRRTNDSDLMVDPRASDPIYARRLRSSWGPHWRCEETAMRIREDNEMGGGITVMSLLLVCKRMFTDVVETAADIAAVYINDLDTLRILLPEYGVLEPGRSPTSVLSDCILPNLKELSITLRLPLDTYEALDHDSNSTGSESTLSSAWTGLRLAVEHLSKLRRLRIWLDHEEPCSWSMVNERAVLSPLASLSNHSSLDVSINLAKLHPKWESPDRHFTADSPPLPLAIHRRYRQRFHGIKSSDGSIKVEHMPDFPALYELGEMPMPMPMPMEQLEEAERRRWREGIDPRQELLRVLEEGICRLGPI